MRTAGIYIFQRGKGDHYALSMDKTGGNLPASANGWMLRAEAIRAHLPEEFTAPLQHVDKYGFALIRCAHRKNS